MDVLVFGTFDRLHPGHQFFLDHAAKSGDLHVVVARDQNVLRIKGHAPDQPEEDRKQAIQKLYPQAQVMLGNPEDFLEPVRSVQPDLILLGYDQKLPPGVSEKDLPCVVERIASFEPEKYKSSLRGAKAPEREAR